MATLTKLRKDNGKLSYRVQDRTTGFPSTCRTFPTRKLATEYQRRIESERAEGRGGVSRGRESLASVIDAYSKSADFRSKKDSRKSLQLLDWWSYRLGNLPINRVSAELIRSHLRKLEQGGRSGSTLNRYRSALSAVFKYAIEEAWTNENPCRLINRKKEGKPRERVITAAEWKALMDECGADRKAIKGNNYIDPVYSPRAQLQNFLIIAYGTAARSSNVRHLRWEYVDLKTKRLTFPDTKAGKPHSLLIADPDVMAALKAQKRISIDGCCWVFPSPGLADVPAHFDAAFKRTRKAAGCDGVDAMGERLVIHSLRHSAATEAGLGGATEFEIGALTGHQSPSMVKRYTKTGEANAAEAMRKRVKPS